MASGLSGLTVSGGSAAKGLDRDLPSLAVVEVRP
jgi:hypothetical protein